MITISIKKSKSFSQKDYIKLVSSFSIHQLSCTCGQKAQLIKHGYYNRKLKSCDGFVTLSILRLRCQSCGKTHAILPGFIVPYSQISLDDQLLIIRCHLQRNAFEPIMLANLLIDENNIRYIIRQYLSHWSERLASFGGSIDSFITSMCFKYFSRQFMQIKCTQNILFP